MRPLNDDVHHRFPSGYIRWRFTTFFLGELKPVSYAQQHEQQQILANCSLMECRTDSHCTRNANASDFWMKRVLSFHLFRCCASDGSITTCRAREEKKLFELLSERNKKLQSHGSINRAYYNDNTQKTLVNRLMTFNFTNLNRSNLFVQDSITGSSLSVDDNLTNSHQG